MEAISSSADFELLLKSCSSSSQTLLVHFWAPWCQPSVQMNEVMDELAKEFTPAPSATQKTMAVLKFAKIEAEAVPELALKYKIAAVPTVVFIKDGSEIDRINGVHPAEVTKKARQLATLATVPEMPKLRSVIAPTGSALSADQSLRARLEKLITSAKCMVFMKGAPESPQCGFSNQLVALLNSLNVDYSTFDILTNEPIKQGLKEYSNWPTFPQLYLDGELIGGLDIIKEMHQAGELEPLLPKRAPADLQKRVEALTKSAPVMVFMKGSAKDPKCKFSRALMEIFSEQKVTFNSFNILDDQEVREGLKKFSNWPTYPQIYVKGELIGGIDIIKELKESGELGTARMV